MKLNDVSLRRCFFEFPEMFFLILSCKLRITGGVIANEANYLKYNQIINFLFICNHVISCTSYFGMCGFTTLQSKKTKQIS